MTKQSREEVLESGVVHFTIGEEFGIRIMEIAMEHLTERHNPIQALKTLTDSLMGCPTDIAVRILKGDVVLIVDVEEQNIMPMDRLPAHDKIFPKIDVLYYMKSRRNEIVKHGEDLKEGLYQLQRHIQKNYGRFSVDFDYEQVFKFVAGDNEDLIDELRENSEIDAIRNLIDSIKRYIRRSREIMSAMEWMYQTWDEFGKGYEKLHEYLTWKGDCHDILRDVMQKLQETLNMNFDKFSDKADDVQKYVEACQEIDKVIESGIEPIDIMENWSAGWLAPNGDYYALNGEIANMLHIQIASALQDKGIIPMYEKESDKELDMKINPDAWLEQHGWVKIHENNINFAGCLNHTMGKKNVNMTDKQIELIRDYITDCHQCLILVGWKRERQSIGMFTAMAMRDPEELNKKYFEF